MSITDDKDLRLEERKEEEVEGALSQSLELTGASRKL
jgi:hypothetical protein